VVDLTPYICHQWWRVAVIPSDEALRAGEIVSLRDALEQYTLSKNKIKDIVLKNKYVAGISTICKANFLH
jgi:hypothetical protein